jgi:hypothetical protein
MQVQHNTLSIFQHCGFEGFPSGSNDFSIRPDPFLKQTEIKFFQQEFCYTQKLTVQ